MSKIIYFYVSLYVIQISETAYLSRGGLDLAVLEYAEYARTAI